MLKPETERVWRVLQDQPALQGFVLVGGTALAMQLHHRISEDLDFAFPGEKLPRTRLDALRRVLVGCDVELTEDDDPSAVVQFADGGLDLLDYQQNYLANRTVRVSFFSPESPERAVLDRSAEPRPALRVASLTELFRLKCLVTARRSRTRDWLDLYVLMTRCGFDLARFHEAFAIAGIQDQAATGLGRLCSGKPHVADEGFRHLASGLPSVEEVQAYFRDQRDRFEQTAAARAWRERHGG